MTRRLVYAVIFLVTFSVYVFSSWRNGSLHRLPEAGDGVDYDAIAFNIWKGQGFGFHWDNPEYLKPYAGLPEYAGLLDRHSDFYPTSYRPPAVPFMMGIVYKLTNRNFTAWRLVQCAVMAGAVTLAASISAGIGGLAAAIIAALLALRSGQLTDYPQFFLTESMAALMLALFAWTWLRNSKRGWTLGRAVLAGAVLGGLIATRSIFVLWTPVALFVPRLPGSTGMKGLLLPKLMCVLGCLLVIGPWWTRNIIITGARLPFGTEGALNLPAGFGPRALSSQGLWNSNHGDGADTIWEQVKPDMLAFEVELARYRQRLTLRWMTRNPVDVARLMRMHVWQEVRPRGDLFSDSLLPIAAFAVLLFRKSTEARVLALMIAANLFGIAMTWSVGGRFMVPLQPLLLALVAALYAVVARRTIAFADRAEG